ncbi:unnamed protein product [Periconia digitata]|uniref:Tyrosinase copper-binding domain-containing protein n=1 Tax=Periconia digitata TaxID=1303443 RepID=A0A9W4U7S0_9PLEO|nr:unnamed protein product [Periconia digitata]
MRFSIATALLGPAILVSGAAIPDTPEGVAPPVPLNEIPKHTMVIEPEQLLQALVEKGLALTNGTILDKLIPSAKPAASKSNNEVNVNAVDDEVSIAATCNNPRVRIEWDSYSNDDKNAYLNAINCLRSRPASGSFPPAGNRYEDLVRLHQQVTDQVHDNAKFLVWHRYFVWVFEDILRSECGFDRALPWWDEGRNTGRFASSSVFSGDFYGAIAIGGQCVTNGKFANSNLNIGPGSSNRVQCLSRAGDSTQTSKLTEDLVRSVNAIPNYSEMAYYAEGTFHAYGHLGVGGTQADKYASPGDPWFWLHHAYVDRNFANWQGGDPNTRLNSINGNDKNGNPLTLDVMVYMNGLRPDVRIRDIMDVRSEKLCYTYQY